MKSLIILLFNIAPLSIFCQSIDSISMATRIDSLLKEGRLLTDAGKYDTALLIIRQTKADALASFGYMSAKYGKSLLIEGRTMLIMEENQKAKELCLEAKSILENTTGKYHADYATNLNTLANVHRNLAEYGQSIPLLLEALSINEKVLGPEHYACGNNHVNLGNNYFDIGDYEKCVYHHLLAKSNWEKSIGKGDEDYITLLCNISNDYIELGNYEKAIQIGLESLTLAEKAVGKEHRVYADCLNNLSLAYRLTLEDDKAIAAAKESLAIREKLFGKENRNYVQSLNNLALMLFDMKQYEKAVELHLESKSIREKLFGKQHPAYAMSLFNLALAYQGTGDHDKAVQLFLETKEIIKNVLGDKHPKYDDILGSLAKAYEYENNAQNAATYYLKSAALTKSLIQKSATYSTESEMLQYEAIMNKKFDNLLYFTQKYPSDSLVCTAYDNALFLGNALLFNTIAREKRIAQADSTTRAIFTEWKSSNSELGQLYTQPVANQNSALIAQLEEKSNYLEQQLVRRSPSFIESRHVINWEEVGKQLQEKEVAIEFVRYKCLTFDSSPDSVMYAALLLRPSGERPSFVPLFEEKQLESLLQSNEGLRADYVNELYASTERGLSTKEKKQKSLKELIWMPLESKLTDVQTIYFAVSGLMHRLNLGAIPIEEEETLGDQFKLIEMGSTRQLVPTNQELEQFDKTAILYGGIKYEIDTTAILGATSAISGDNIAQRSRSVERSQLFDQNAPLLRGNSWDYLKWTEKEVKSLALIMKNVGIKASSKTGHTATEESFKAIGEGQPSPYILHIASHGFFFPDPNSQTKDDAASVFKVSENPMIRSGLVLAGGNYAWKNGKPLHQGMDDGILTAYEISLSNLSNTELVVLSACETGLGHIHNTEGVYGLQRAFKIAGARYIIMSLWQVPDQETSVFMTRFYGHWLEGKMSIHDAFRATQREMRERFINPYQWAGFVLVE